MPNSRYDPDSRYWEEPESNEDLDPSYYWADDSYDDDEPEFDCGFIPDYGCQLAGTEECDWECPYSKQLHAHSDYPNVTLAPIGNIIRAIALIEMKQPPDGTIQP